jgi:hypothetical protein
MGQGRWERPQGILMGHVRVYKQVKDFLAAIETKAEKKKGTQVPPESENEIKNKKMIQLR